MDLKVKDGLLAIECSYPSKDDLRDLPRVWLTGNEVPAEIGDMADATLLQLETPKIKLMMTHPRVAMAIMWCPSLSARLLFGPDNHILSMSHNAQRLYLGGLLPPNIDRDQEYHMSQALGK
eukprot:1201026-Ditylum_brightwellii.AAC.1